MLMVVPSWGIAPLILDCLFFFLNKWPPLNNSISDPISTRCGNSMLIFCCTWEFIIYYCCVFTLYRTDYGTFDSIISARFSSWLEEILEMLLLSVCFYWEDSRSLALSCDNRCDSVLIFAHAQYRVFLHIYPSFFIVDFLLLTLGFFYEVDSEYWQLVPLILYKTFCPARDSPVLF